MSSHDGLSQILEGKWTQLKGSVQEEWGELTDDDLDVIEGRYERLVGTLQEKYGYEKNRAQREVDDFLRRI